MSTVIKIANGRQQQPQRSHETNRLTRAPQLNTFANVQKSFAQHACAYFVVHFSCAIFFSHFAVALNSLNVHLFGCSRKCVRYVKCIYFSQQLPMPLNNLNNFDIIIKQLLRKVFLYIFLFSWPWLLSSINEKRIKTVLIHAPMPKRNNNNKN